MFKGPAIRFCATVTFSILIVLSQACAQFSSAHKNEHSDQSYTGKENSRSQTSNNGHYRVKLYSNVSPIPTNKIHTWTVHVETLSGIAVEDAKIFVFGGMPMHRHDFPTKVYAKQYLGNGDYLVEGIKFSMPGHWEMRFTIKSENIEDRVAFKIMR